MPPPSAARDSLHVVHYIHKLREEQSGVVRSVLDLTQALAKYGCRVTVVTTDAGGTPPQADAEYGPHVELVRLPRPLIGRIAPEVGSRLAAIFRSASVAHFHTLWDPHNLEMAAAARRAGVPYIVTTHGMLDDHAFRYKRIKKQLFLTLAGNRFLRNASRLHCTAEGEKRQVQSRVSGVPIAVIPLLFDVARYTNLPGPQLAASTFDCLERPGPKVLFLSRLDPIKGPDVLIEAAARLRGKRDFQLVMAGPGEKGYVGRLQALVREHELESRTSFVGMVSGDLKLSLYQACDLFVLPTMQENFGMVFPESLACGLPVVTTNQIDTLVELGEAGARLVPRNSSAFAEAIDQSLSDVGALKTLGQRGRAYVFKWLETEKVAQRYVSLYRAAAAGAGAV